MLNGLDEMMWHQLPTTFDHVWTSDPRFYDRHWLAIYDPDGSAAMQFTMGVYSNMNVIDAGMVIVRGGKQHNVRASRSLRPLLQQLCGPFGLEIVDPYRTLRLTLGDGPHAMQGALEWTGLLGPEEEPQHFTRRRGRVMEDYARYDQSGVCTGWVEVAGQRVELDRWWSARDHSWGVRPGTGVEEPYTGPDEHGVVPHRSKSSGRDHFPHDRFVFLHFFLATPALAGHVFIMYRGEERWRLDCSLRDPNDPRATLLGATDSTMAIIFSPQTRRFSRFELGLTLDGGREATFIADAMGGAIAMPGLGYSGGFADGRGLGAWRGDDHVEWDTWDVSHPEVVTLDDGTATTPTHRIQPVHVTIVDSDGRSEGTGSATLLVHGGPPRSITVA